MAGSRTLVLGDPGTADALAADRPVVDQDGCSARGVAHARCVFSGRPPRRAFRAQPAGTASASGAFGDNSFPQPGVLRRAGARPSDPAWCGPRGPRPHVRIRRPLSRVGPRGSPSGTPRAAAAGLRAAVGDTPAHSKVRAGRPSGLGGCRRGGGRGDSGGHGLCLLHRVRAGAWAVPPRLMVRGGLQASYISSGGRDAHAVRALGQLRHHDRGPQRTRVHLGGEYRRLRSRRTQHGWSRPPVIRQLICRRSTQFQHSPPMGARTSNASDAGSQGVGRGGRTASVTRFSRALASAIQRIVFLPRRSS